MINISMRGNPYAIILMMLRSDYAFGVNTNCPILIMFKCSKLIGNNMRYITYYMYYTSTHINYNFKVVSFSFNRLLKYFPECYRTTIINDLKNIAVEIDTDLMEETFKGKTVPKAVLDKCISTKGELPRVERAKYFLQYVLLKGEMVSAFADVLSYSTKVVLNFSPCETHGGKITL